MTHLRKMMLEELQRRNYAQSTVEAYISALREFARYFKRPPDQLGPDHVRQFQLHLLRDRNLAPNTVKQRMAAVQFFFLRTLKRAYLREDFPYPKIPRRLPVILSQEEVTRLTDSAVAPPISAGSGKHCGPSRRRAVALRPKQRYGLHRGALFGGTPSTELSPLLRCRATAPIGSSEAWFSGSANRLM